MRGVNVSVWITAGQISAKVIYGHVNVFVRGENYKRLCFACVNKVWPCFGGMCFVSTVGE